jgi:hypothetical protein
MRTAELFRVGALVVEKRLSIERFSDFIQIAIIDDAGGPVARQTDRWRQ